jgi:hypothetical protein
MPYFGLNETVFELEKSFFWQQDKRRQFEIQSLPIEQHLGSRLSGFGANATNESIGWYSTTFNKLIFLFHKHFFNEEIYL